MYASRYFGSISAREFSFSLGVLENYETQSSMTMYGSQTGSSETEAGL